MTAHFLDVTELPGTPVSAEQVDRLRHKYLWAAERCRDKDTAEVACGAGPGLGLLASASRTFRAGDWSPEILQFAQRHYGERVDLSRIDAQNLPWGDASLDVVMLFEALYYLPHPDRFVDECRRVLREGGEVLVIVANRDLYDFNPSPHSFRYHGVRELGELFGSRGFSTEFFGVTRVDAVSTRQRALRPVKRAAARLGLIPKTMRGKALLKRLVFGRLQEMPAEVAPGVAPFEPPEPVAAGEPDRRHKVIYCVARLGDAGALRAAG